jgi:signal transduction histidine kinase
VSGLPGWPHQSLRGRLALTYAGVALLSVTAAAGYSAGALRSLVLDLIATSLLSQAHLVAETVRSPLGSLDSRAITSYLTRVDPLTHARILVLDRQGQYVAATVDPPPIDSRPGDAWIADALAGNTVVVTSVDRATPNERVQVTVPVVAPDGRIDGVVRASFTLEEVQAIFGQLTRASAIGAAAAAVLAALTGLVLASSVARPIRDVARGATALAATSTAPALAEPDSGPAEVRALVRAFNDLAGQLAAFEQARREFASDVSHELHSLASAMQTAAEALDRGAAGTDPELGRQLVAGLVGHTHRLSRLAEDLLELARLEGGRLRLDFDSIDLQDVVAEVHNEWLAEAKQRGVSLLAVVPAGPLAVDGDAARLVQALGNLVENALKHAGAAGQVTLDVRPARDDRFRLAVQDSGPGIPAEALTRVFDRYFRVEGRGGHGPGGMGLGLAIARGIALGHGGDLWAENAAEGGARFVLELPAGATSQRAGTAQLTS